MPRAQRIQQSIAAYTVLATNSSSNGLIVYEIRRGHDSVVYCTCPAWRMKQGRASCKHVDAWRTSNFQRPKRVTRDGNLLAVSIRSGDVIEVNSRGDVFLLRVSEVHVRAADALIKGTELLDAGEAACSRDGLRDVDFRDVTRVVVPAAR